MSARINTQNAVIVEFNVRFLMHTLIFFLSKLGGGKALTMTTDTLEFPPWAMVKTVILCSNFVIKRVKSMVNHFDLGKFVFWPWPWSKWVFFGLISCRNLRLTISTMENLDFGHGHGRNFDHLTIVISKFWQWSWSKIFDHMTMTPARRPNGQKIMVALPPPPKLKK